MSDQPNNEREEIFDRVEDKPFTGEYRYVRPENGEHYTDAQYIPRDQVPNTPRHYSYAAEEADPRKRADREKKRSRRVGVMAALCLVCVLLGAAVGVIGVTQWENWFVQEPQGEESYPVEMTPEPTAVPSTPVPTAVPQSDGTVMDPAVLYDMACTQVVGITTEVTYYNRFGMTSTSPVVGSGFIISQDGYILTNHHVIEEAVKGGYEVEVMLYNGDTYVAEIVGYEAETSDIAVLKINAEGLNAVTMGDSNAMRVGRNVFAVGNPLGELAYSMTDGMISALDRDITTTDSNTGRTTTVNMFQISAAVNSGNSGGPVYNDAGEVIGVVTAKYSSTGVEGLGFAIPINDALAIANDLMEIGYVRGKPYMGITVQTVSSTVAQYYNMVEGAYVYSVEENSPAQAAGLRMGDIITKLNDTEIFSSTDLTNTQKNYRAGETVTLTVYRENQYMEIRLTFGEKVPEAAVIQETAQQPENSQLPDSGRQFPNSWQYPFS